MSRLAVYSLLPWGLEIVREWAESAEHEVAVLVTRPDPKKDPGLSSRVAAQVGRDTLVMITPRVTDSVGVISEMDIDLALIFAYSHIPESVADAPKHGTVNMHPALLPDYRGPNPNRALYEGEARIGTTVHRIVEEFDAGPILAQAACDVPDEVDPDSVRAAWRLTMRSVLDEGIPKALADDPGRPQDAASTKVASVFRDDELELDWTLPARLLQCRLTAILLDSKQPVARIGGELQPIRGFRVLDGLSANGPGEVLATSRRAVIGVADAVVEVDVGRLPY